MLTPEERKLLDSFVKRNSPDTPYWGRVQIVLLTAEGATQEQIATQLGLPIQQVRLGQRAFDKQRLAAFPETIFLPPPLFSPDDAMAEAGRRLLQDMQARMDEHWDAAATSADTLAVHEVRKAIRQTFTIIRLFSPYFVQGSLAGFRRRWRRVMRRLGRARDITIFGQNLGQCLDQADLPEPERTALCDLHTYWEKEGAAANKTLIRYLRRGKVARLRDNYRYFLANPGESLIPAAAAQTPVRFVAPLIITQKLITVRQDEPLLSSGSLTELHQLRIHFKELRYTIRFFEPLLGLDITPCLTMLEEVQDHLGWLNDAQVGLELLAEIKTPQPGADLYGKILQQQAEQFRDTFKPIWDRFNSLIWRQTLGLALARF